MSRPREASSGCEKLSKSTELFGQFAAALRFGGFFISNLLLPTTLALCIFNFMFAQLAQSLTDSKPDVFAVSASQTSLCRWIGQFCLILR